MSCAIVHVSFRYDEPKQEVFIKHSSGVYYKPSPISSLGVAPRELVDSISEATLYLKSIVNGESFKICLNCDVRIYPRNFTGTNDVIRQAEKLVPILEGMTIDFSDWKATVHDCKLDVDHIKSRSDYDNYCAKYNVYQAYFHVDACANLLAPVEALPEKNLKLRFRRPKKILDNRPEDILMVGANYDNLRILNAPTYDACLATIKEQDSDKIELDAIKVWIKESFYHKAEGLGLLYLTIRDISPAVQDMVVWPDLDNRGCSSTKLVYQQEILIRVYESLGKTIQAREALIKEFNEFIEKKKSTAKTKKDLVNITLEDFMAQTLYQNVRLNPLKVKSTFESLRLYTNPLKEIVDRAISEIDDTISEEEEIED